MIEWEDTSSWSQKDVDRTPKAWTAHIGLFRVVVYRHRDYGPDQWLATCHPYVFKEFALKSKDIEEAKCQALAKLQGICLDVVRTIDPGKPSMATKEDFDAAKQAFDDAKKTYGS